MSDWSSELATALAEGDTERMKTMLTRVPKHVIDSAIPYIAEMARTSLEEGNLEEASAYFSQLIEAAPEKAEWYVGRARARLKLDLLQDAVSDADRVVDLDPDHALGYRLRAQARDGLREWDAALNDYRKVLELDPNDAQASDRIRRLEQDSNAHGATDGSEAEDAKDAGVLAMQAPPSISFVPDLFDAPVIDSSFDASMVQGVKQLLHRYSGQQSVKNSLSRLDDPVWLDAWNQALSTTKNSRVLLRGSELGLFVLQALQHGAERAVAVEEFSLDGRVSFGVVQKNLLAQWHAMHAKQITEWTEEERRESFAVFAGSMDIVPPQSEVLAEASYDCFVFPNIDHSLLGTGIVRAVREHRKSLVPGARVLPARAKLFAMAIEWNYQASAFRVDSMNEFRWSFYPQPLDLPQSCWTARTQAVCVGDIDFENFSESTHDIELRVTSSGRVDAIVFWFEMELGDARICNSPDNTLRCIRPAVQYTDPIDVEEHAVLSMTMHASETRLHFKTSPAATQTRTSLLPSWYVPMLVDGNRNAAYRHAIDTIVRENPDATILDIGAGCGLLSMMAVEAGAKEVIACEVSEPIAAAGERVLAANGLDAKVRWLRKDCRALRVPEDVAEQADIAVFELFDCSLIGEGVLHFLSYAREHLLKKGARYLPRGAKLCGMLVEYRLDRVWEHDVNLLNPYRFSTSYLNVDAREISYKRLSEPFDIFSFDFATATTTADEKELALRIKESGTAGGILFWFELQLLEDLWISTGPDSPQSFHWKQGLQFLPELHVRSGMVLPVLAKHDGSSLAFRWKAEEVPKECISRLPRFDPRWLAAVNELEQQMQGLLQHCHMNPAEYAKVADLAIRFAIDPAAHALDPMIAQRFAGKFFSA